MAAKKNIVFIARSLDGYIAGKAGELDWLELVPNPTGDDLGYAALMAEVDAIVMGRHTFETVWGFGGEWPYTKPVFVLSLSLQSLPPDVAEKVQLVGGTPAAGLARVHGQAYHRLYSGGGRTIQAFLREDLIDELRITTIPILLGGGFPLFGDLPQALVWEHLHSTSYLGQLVQNHYRRRRDKPDRA